MNRTTEIVWLCQGVMRVTQRHERNPRQRYCDPLKHKQAISITSLRETRTQAEIPAIARNRRLSGRHRLSEPACLDFAVSDNEVLLNDFGDSNSRNVSTARSTAFLAASSQGVVLVPISSMTLYYSANTFFTASASSGAVYGFASITPPSTYMAFIPSVMASPVV